MSSTNPPHNHQTLADHWNRIRPLSNFAAFATFVRTGLALAPLATPSAVALPHALRWRLYTPHSLHHVVAQEIDRLFQPMVPASWTPAAGLPPFTIACSVAGCTGFSHPGRPQAVLQADVAALPSCPTPSPLAIDAGRQAERQGNRPEIPLAEEIGLAEQLASGKGIFTCYLMDALLLSSAGMLMLLKDTLDLPRPSEPVWTPAAQPTMTVPMHRSFPGGHAMQLALISRLLVDVMKLNAAERTRIDSFVIDVSDARRDAGVHTQHDNDGGRDIGLWMADCLLTAESDTAKHPRWAALMELARAEW